MVESVTFKFRFTSIKPQKGKHCLFWWQCAVGSSLTKPGPAAGRRLQGPRADFFWISVCGKQSQGSVRPQPRTALRLTQTHDARRSPDPVNRTHAQNPGPPWLTCDHPGAPVQGAPDPLLPFSSGSQAWAFSRRPNAEHLGPPVLEGPRSL